MTFKEWWSKHAIEEADILPILKLSFKELANSAWEAALWNHKEEVARATNRCSLCHGTGIMKGVYDVEKYYKDKEG